ncbi:hypothetical protein ACPXCH_13210 [Streptomyces albogriseolus]
MSLIPQAQDHAPVLVLRRVVMVRAVNSVLAETGRMMTKMPRQGRADGED